MGCEDRPELWVPHDGGVTDAVECLDRIDDADGMESTPRAGCVHARVDLDVQVTVRVTGTRGVVPHDRSLNLLDGHLDLSTARTDASGRVLRDPPDDLLGRACLCGFVGGSQVGMECGGE